jgi:UDP-N-acetylmuramate--alanine ligase
MMIWACKQLRIPISYSVGSTISFGPSGKFEPDAEYFVYECDEFDRNFLHFEPSISLITSLDYDHADTYPTIGDYRTAFVKFIEQSGYTHLWEKDLRFLHADPQADLEAYD